MELGCDEATVKAALVAHDFDVEKAANALLLAGAGAAEETCIAPVKSLQAAARVAALPACYRGVFGPLA